MRVSYFDKEMAENEELRKRYPRGVARIIKRFYTTCYCTLTPWEDIENTWVGANINIPYYNDGYEHGDYGDWRGPVGVPMSDAKLEREGWCTTATGKAFLEELRIEKEEEARIAGIHEDSMVDLLRDLERICTKVNVDWDKVIGRSLLRKNT